MENFAFFSKRTRKNLSMTSENNNSKPRTLSNFSVVLIPRWKMLKGALTSGSYFILLISISISAIPSIHSFTIWGFMLFQKVVKENRFAISIKKVREKTDRMVSTFIKNHHFGCGHLWAKENKRIHIENMSKKNILPRQLSHSTQFISMEEMKRKICFDSFESIHSWHSYDTPRPNNAHYNSQGDTHSKRLEYVTRYSTKISNHFSFHRFVGITS